ncbi:alpha/beta hydrolase [Gracilaria domingensis]|nr:alpha/beta hydrolase [Gracilaria domingensis]
MVLGTFLSNMLVKPYQDGGIFESPDQYDLPFEAVSFETDDGLTLKGWLIPAEANKVVIQSHFGVQANRCGWQRKGKGLFAMWDADISFLKHVKYLNSRGYTVLMFDMRNHGESAKSVDMPWVSYGYCEALDVIAAVKFIESHEKYKDADIGLLSICMGAAASTFAYDRDDGLAKHTNIKAMVAVQPLTYKGFVDALRLPSFLRRMIDDVTNSRLQCDMNERSFVPLAKNIRAPTLVVQNKNDYMTDFKMVEEFFSELTVTKEMKWLDVEKSRFAGYNYVTQHPEEVLFWFDRFM